LMTIDQQLQSMTENALRRGVIIFTIFAIPTTLTSISRGIRGEWHPVFTLQLTLLLVLLITAALRHSLPRRILGGIIVALCVIVALAGIYTYGTIAPAGHWFMAIAVFFIGMLYGLRGMVIGALTLLAGMLIIACLHLSGLVSPAIAPAEFAVTQSSWLVELMCAAVFIALVLPTLRNFVEANERWMSGYELRREKIAHMAMHDELTGLPLLRAARDRLSIACNRCRRSDGMLAVLFIDLDGFKLVNDSYGHEAGNTCLRAVAARLRGRLREQDTAARIGGDEFIVVLDNVSGRNAAGSLARELIALIRRPIDFEGHQLHIGASIGVAMCPENGNNVPSLLRNADAAMYRSKRAGRNGFVFSEVDASADSAGEQDGPEPDDRAEAAANSPETRGPSMRKQLLETIVNRCILVLAGAISLTVLANIWRIAFNEKAPNLGPTLVALVVVAVLFFWHKTIALRSKLALTICLGMLIGLPGLFVSGLAAPAVGWALAAAIFLFGIFYEKRLCWAIAIVVLVAILLSGLGFVSGVLVHHFDVNQQALHPSKWLVFLLAGMAYGGMVLVAWFQYQKTTSRLIEESTAQTAELVRLATIDELTGLPLLRLASDRLAMACRRAQRANSRAALLLVDLDGFKAVNDSFGHDAGDHCLREVARRMSACLRDSDTTARIGGDEFLVILDAVDDFKQVSATAHRLIKDIAPPIEFGDHLFAVSASIGISVFPDHGTDGEALRQHADAAMYVAKRAGKNRFHFAEPESAD
jgi:diguanylate cyclase (GGDEF)-like protein